MLAAVLLELGRALERQPTGQVALDDLVAGNEVLVHRRRGGDRRCSRGCRRGRLCSRRRRAGRGCGLGRGRRLRRRRDSGGRALGLGDGALAARALVQPARPCAWAGVPGAAGVALGTVRTGAACLGALGSLVRRLAAASLVAADDSEPVRAIGTRASVRAESGMTGAAAGTAAATTGGALATGGGGGAVSISSTTGSSSVSSSAAAVTTGGAAAATAAEMTGNSAVSNTSEAGSRKVMLVCSAFGGCRSGGTRCGRRCGGSGLGGGCSGIHRRFDRQVGQRLQGGA